MGRPRKTVQNECARMARDACPEALEVLISLMRDDGILPNTRVAIAQDILKRGLGDGQIMPEETMATGFDLTLKVIDADGEHELQRL